MSSQRPVKQRPGSQPDPNLPGPEAPDPGPLPNPQPPITERVFMAGIWDWTWSDAD